MKKYYETFLKAPIEMKKICIFRMIVSIIFIIVGIVFLILGEGNEKYELAITIITIGIVCFFMGLWFVYITITEKYQYIECTCIDIEYTSVKHLIKNIYVVAEGEKAKIPVKTLNMKVSKGERIYLYIPIRNFYIENGITNLNSYYAIGIAKSDNKKEDYPIEEAEE